MNLSAIFNRSSGKHRQTRASGRGDGGDTMLPLLAEHNDTTTTQPLRGLPDEQLMRDCPMDGCDWPRGIYVPSGDQHHLRLLQHLHGHNSQDVIRTVDRLERAIEKLQART